MVSRLFSIAPDLDKALTTARRECSCAAAWAAARWAADSVGLPHTSHNSQTIRELVERLDEEYFAVNQTSPQAGLAAFSKARAANAIEFAYLDQPHEAVYEAAIATDDIPTLRAIIDSSLEKLA